MSEDKTSISYKEDYQAMEADFCETLIYEAHQFEVEALKEVIDHQEIIDNLERLLRSAIRLRDFRKIGIEMENKGE